MRALTQYTTGWPVLLLSVLFAFEPAAYAQFDDPITYPPAYTPIQNQPAFSQQELDQMLAPIALYPDPLLSQILMAATYPVEVVESARWSRANPNLMGDDAVRAIQQMHWDPSVKSLVAFPQILQMMDAKLDWTERLGDAFLDQDMQVMDTIQFLRKRAYSAGNLISNEQIQVEPQGQTIVLQPMNPEIIYVPYYDPAVVYGAWWWPAYPPIYWAPWPGYYPRPGFAFGFAWGNGVPIASEFFFGFFDWHQRRVNVANVNNYYYNRAESNTRRDRRNTNSTSRGWQHNPNHRRGVPYRDELSRQQYGRAGDTRETQHDFRGYDQPSLEMSGAPGNRLNDRRHAITLPDWREDLAAPDDENHRARSRNVPPEHSAKQPKKDNPHPRAPGIIRHRPVEVKPPALEDTERGSDARNHSSRGRPALEGAAQNQHSAPAQRPSDKPQAANASGDEKEKRKTHSKAPEQSHGNDHDKE